MVEFLPFLTMEITFVTSCYAFRTPKFFTFRVDPFSEEVGRGEGSVGGVQINFDGLPPLKVYSFLFSISEAFMDWVNFLVSIYKH